MARQTHLKGIFEGMVDHRVNRTKRHTMESILFITLSAVISGCDTWNEIETFGELHQEWIEKYVELPNGIPSHDTLNRFFSSMDPIPFEECFRKWVSALTGNLEDTVVAIDGKSIKSCKTTVTTSLHMVSAWSNAAGLTLGQVKRPSKGGEMTAVRELLDTLYLEGTIVTMDALAKSPHIANKIVSKGANYVIQVKGNNKYMHNGIKSAFGLLLPEPYIETPKYKGEQIKERRTRVLSSDLLPDSAIPTDWHGLRSIICVERTTENDTSTSYYISSLELTPQRAAEIIRSHWAIENSLHWMLDVAFDEDGDRKRNHNSVQNFSLIRKIALTGLRNTPYKNIGVESRRKIAFASHDYREKVLEALK